MNLEPLLIGMATLTLTALSVAPIASTQTTTSAQSEAFDATRVRYKTIEVDGMKIFYREAGDPSKPTILLLHGFPSSSHMFRDLLPLLASNFHLVAPDYPGAGYSEAPSAAKFTPTFENLADVMADFIQRVGLKRFTVYMQDFGGPVGFRLAVKHPEWVQGLIIQNANAYVEGIAPELRKSMQDRFGIPAAAQRAQIDQVVSRDFAIRQYKTGVRDFAAMNPDAWNVDGWVLENPDVKRIQGDLIVNYYDNIVEYPRWQAYLREHQPKTLIVWGKNDQIFLPPGAEAYQRDLPHAELHYFNTGHFALEEDAPGIAKAIDQFFRSTSRPAK